LRADRAERLIPEQHRDGRILDVGCGSFPYFLAHTRFAEKFAIDKLASIDPPKGISWHVLDLNISPRFPFPSGFFSVVTMLAVVEHLNPEALVDLFRECGRVIVPGGSVVITTPAAWSTKLLSLMALLRLVSREEIDEHVFAYTLPLIGWYFGAAGFPMSKIRFGYFELGLNLWAVASK
jgi:SAM-dependent methyltransferase